MNARSVAIHSFFPLFHYYAYDCAVILENKQTKKIRKTNIYGSTVARLPVLCMLTFIYLWLLLYGINAMAATLIWSITFFAASGPKKRLCNSSNY